MSAAGPESNPLLPSHERHLGGCCPAFVILGSPWGLWLYVRTRIETRTLHGVFPPTGPWSASQASHTSGIRCTNVASFTLGPTRQVPGKFLSGALTELWSQRVCSLSRTPQKPFGILPKITGPRRVPEPTPEGHCDLLAALPMPPGAGALPELGFGLWALEILFSWLLILMCFLGIRQSLRDISHCLLALGLVCKWKN